jgi:putative ABC transport system substrate-binding protein
LAADLVNRKVTLIHASGGSFVTAAAKAATSTIPIVFQGAGLDPIQTGLVASLNRPGGNVTGVMNLGDLALGPKQIDFLRELLPATSSVGLLVNRSAFGEANSMSTREAAQAQRWEVYVSDTTWQTPCR